ncbi:PTS system mannose/fructose/sorbose family transporter subunit IID [Allobaculum stercoricanis]|uniref:PTS system mannose/fructose/sorbose family transporter subunit IID n=1 Tax=Allobaculum stercoricanis TaxID=174709 RepID=UPI00035EB267|nr:PTS system mannose/fructose/sorbose family transporter subunit IID [Allobaculum stercoricanis]
MEENKNNQITKKDLRRVFLHSLTIMCSWNYERQMHMGFMYGMAPVLDKLYKNDEKRKKEAYQRHMEFFNCTPQMTPFIMGLAASMEEQNANSEEGEFQTESISMIKTSLMGPFAGIGDSFFQGTLRIITFGIGLSFAQQGSILGPILAVGLFAIPSLLAAYYATFLGYNSGNKYLAKLYQEGLMDRVMHFASIVGLAVIGGMVASMVNITTPLQFQTGGTQLVLQEMLDTIFPKLLPLVFTLGIYTLIQKKVNTNVLLIGIIVTGLITSAIGIL